jgi:hypothetical protein
MRNVSNSHKENQYTRILCSVTLSENRAIYENNVEKCGTVEQATD